MITVKMLEKIKKISLKNNLETFNKIIENYDFVEDNQKENFLIEEFENYKKNNEIKFGSKFILEQEIFLKILPLDFVENNIDYFNINKKFLKLLFKTFKNQVKTPSQIQEILEKHYFESSKENVEYMFIYINKINNDLSKINILKNYFTYNSSIDFAFNKDFISTIDSIQDCKEKQEFLNMKKIQKVFHDIKGKDIELKEKSFLICEFNLVKIRAENSFFSMNLNILRNVLNNYYETYLNDNKLMLSCDNEEKKVANLILKKTSEYIKNSSSFYQEIDLKNYIDKVLLNNKIEEKIKLKKQNLNKI